RDIDTVARYGGEEFSVILPNTSLGDAVKVAWKLNQRIEAMSRDRNATKEPKVTVSVGVSSFPTDAITMQDSINHADTALYRAKAKGRNRVISYEENSDRTPLRVVE